MKTEKEIQEKLDQYKKKLENWEKEYLDFPWFSLSDSVRYEHNHMKEVYKTLKWILEEE